MMSVLANLLSMRALSYRSRSLPQSPARSECNLGVSSFGRKAANIQIAISQAGVSTTETGQQMVEVDLGMLDQQKIALVSLQDSTDSWLRENLLAHRDADVYRRSLSYSLKGP